MIATRVTHRYAIALLAVVALAGCSDERPPPRGLLDSPANPPAAPGVRTSVLRPGPVVDEPESRAQSPYQGDPLALAQGFKLYQYYNCVGCHSLGGGGMGPPFLDAEWRYGSEPAQIYASIVQGRPNGMPSFGGRIPEDEVWKLVSYLRALGKLEPVGPASKALFEDPIGASPAQGQVEPMIPKETKSK